MCLRIMTQASGEICLAIVLTVSVNRTATKQVPDPRHPAEKDLEERRLWFARSLHLWQQDRGQRQAVVIAENHDPPETLKPNQTYAKHYPNLELVAFQHSTQVERDECGEPTEYMGEHELIALNMARRRAKRVQNATHVVMVSGRYYIPSLALGVVDTTGITKDSWWHSTVSFTLLIHVVTYKLFVDVRAWNSFSLITNLASLLFYYITAIILSSGTIAVSI